MISGMVCPARKAAMAIRFDSVSTASSGSRVFVASLSTVWSAGEPPARVIRESRFNQQQATFFGSLRELINLAAIISKRRGQFTVIGDFSERRQLLPDFRFAAIVRISCSSCIDRWGSDGHQRSCQFSERDFCFGAIPADSRCSAIFHSSRCRQPGILNYWGALFEAPHQPRSAMEPPD